MVDDVNAALPTQARNPQSGPASLVDTAATEKMLSMARSICRQGYLHRYVPAQPRWCRTIDDQIELALRRQQDVHPRDLQRLAYVFEKAQARQKAKIMNRKPKPGTALLSICFEEYGIVQWHCRDVPLRDPIIPPGADCA